VGPEPLLPAGVIGNVRLADLLAHLYVLVPVLDAGKHYFIGRDEVDKLLARARLAGRSSGTGVDHPRYLMRRQCWCERLCRG